MSDTHSDPHKRLAELLKKVNIAMLSTRGSDGHFHSRPMATSDVEFDGAVYFLTDEHSGKIHDLEKDAEAIVTYSDEKQQIYIALRGRGELIRDKAVIKEHWTAQARGWFPKGPDDPNVELIKIAIVEAEFWDAPNQKAVILFAYAKAMLTGERPKNIGEHERIEVGG
jgi:general stress protein 26